MNSTYSRDVNLLLLICGYGVCLFMGLLCAVLLWKIYTNQIDLTKLVSEANGDASMSRFQLLIFTMIVAISLFILVVKNWNFPTVPDGVLGLLGISASTYAVAKGIQFSQPQTLIDPVERRKTLNQVQEMSNTGARVEVKADSLKTTGTPEPEREPASAQGTVEGSAGDDGR